MEYSLIFILGACIGSFLNVLIIRTPQGLNVVTLKSHCTHCQKALRWFYNIPLFSYVFLQGKCAYCQKKISIQYIVVELLSALVALLLYLKMGLNMDYILTSTLFYILMVLAFIDLKYKAVPDSILLMALIFVFVVKYENLLEAFQNAAIFAGTFVLLEFIVTFYIQNIKSKLLKDESLEEAKALGEGDIPILAIMGALLGIQGGMFAVFLGALFAIIPSLYNSLKNKDSQTPFIPYLLLGLIVEYLFEISKVFI